jgi:predicted ATPase/DNA-binding XRE family transcriptional regulator
MKLLRRRSPPRRPRRSEPLRGIAVDEGLSFATLLRQYRLASGLSQEALAERAGLTAQGVGALERGQRRAPYRDTVRALADALGLGVAERDALSRSVARARAHTEPATVTMLPPVAVPPAYPGLPLPSDALVGRAREIAEVAALLRESDGHLVTLLGPGGVGKTRLALEAARVATPHFADGVQVVSLAPLADHRLVGPTIARALGARESADDRQEEALRVAIGAQRLLLVLDNLEQLLPATALIAALLDACPGLVILATSRTALRARREWRYAVPPLALPPPGADPNPEALAHTAAVALFVHRARQVDPSFALADANAAAVAAICRRLDGLPLALELAAARLVLLSPAGLLARLDRALPLLTGGRRDLPERQQTLRATLAWSYDLLSSGEQAVFRRLAPFAGGWTLAAAAAVCAVDEALEVEILDWLGALIEHSLVRREPTGDGEPRFAMLETVREYAAERLARDAPGRGEGSATRQRHAEYFLALAEGETAALNSPSPQAALERLECEHDNLRAALAWFLAQPDGSEAALRLAGALWRFWLMRGYASQGRAWLDRALAAAGATAALAARALALGGAGALAHSQGDYAQAATCGEESLQHWRELGDPAGIAGALGLLALARRGQGEYAVAAALSEEALDIWRAQGDRQRTSATLTNLGALANDRGDYARAEGYLTESLALKRELGDTQGIAIALHNLAECARYLGDNDRAAALLEESLALFRALGGRPRVAHALHSLGMAEFARADTARATALLLESLDLFRALDEQSGAILCLEGLAQLADSRGDHALAVRLLGCVDAQRAALGFARAPVDRATLDAVLARARAALGPPAFAAAWTLGRGLSLVDAAALVGH